MQNYNKTRNCGFTLIELSVVMVIIGLLTIAALKLYEAHMQKNIVVTTNDNIKSATAALQKYQQDHGFYPCPADPTDTLGHATNCAMPATGGIKVVAGTGGRNVRIGVMPILDMSGDNKIVNGSQAVDGWKNRLTYAVVESMADAATFDKDNGAITVNDAETGSALTTKSNIIVLSHGEVAAGAYTTAGVLTAACPTGTKDEENCNDDATFVAGKRTFAAGAQFNDDYVEYSTATNAAITDTCDPGQVLRGITANGDLICTSDLNCPAGHAFTGLLADGVTPNCQLVSSTCNATEALVSMTIGSPPVCIRNMPGDCPVGFIQNGTNNTPGSEFGKPICLALLMQCPANYVQVGMQANNQPICVPNFNSSCPEGQIQIGNDGNGSAICKNIDLAACPAGAYMFGMSNGAPMCSNDRTVNDGNCAPGQVVTGINGGNVTCGAVPGALGACNWYMSSSTIRTGPDGNYIPNGRGEYVMPRYRYKPADWCNNAPDLIARDPETGESICILLFDKQQGWNGAYCQIPDNS
ncbi:MAG: type II secretion system protein [Hyphomicrobium sp.]